MTEQIEKTLDFLRTRKRAYEAAFGAKDSVLRRDFEKFCRANASCFNPDPRLHAVLEGRREVWLRIAQHLDNTPEELAALYGAAVIDNSGGQE